MLDKYVSYESVAEPKLKKALKVEEPKLTTHVYLVFPALEDIVSDSLRKNENGFSNYNVLTFKLNGYHKTKDRRLKDSDNLENTVWNTIVNANGLFSSVVLTDDMYIENILSEHNVPYTVVYPESANREDYLNLLNNQGYGKSMIEHIKNDWSGFIQAISTKFQTQGAFTNYIK